MEVMGWMTFLHPVSCLLAEECRSLLAFLLSDLRVCRCLGKPPLQPCLAPPWELNYSVGSEAGAAFKAAPTRDEVAMASLTWGRLPEGRQQRLGVNEPALQPQLLDSKPGAASAW